MALWSGYIDWACNVNVVSAVACPHALGAMQVSDEQMKELAVKTETTNPWYWGVRTLVKVGPAGSLPENTVTVLRSLPENTVTVLRCLGQE